MGDDAMGGSIVSERVAWYTCCTEGGADMRRTAAKLRNGKLVIPKTLTGGIELVILTRDLYEREVRHGKGIADALHVIAEGERAYREGRTLKASSLEEALKLHGKRSS